MKNQTIEITSERIDDIPVVVEWLKQMEIAKWIDKSLSNPHFSQINLRGNFGDKKLMFSRIAIFVMQLRINNFSQSPKNSSLDSKSHSIIKNNHEKFD